MSLAGLKDLLPQRPAAPADGPVVPEAWTRARAAYRAGTPGTDVVWDAATDLAEAWAQHMAPQMMELAWGRLAWKGEAFARYVRTEDAPAVHVASSVGRRAAQGRIRPRILVGPVAWNPTLPSALTTAFRAVVLQLLLADEPLTAVERLTMVQHVQAAWVRAARAPDGGLRRARPAERLGERLGLPSDLQKAAWVVGQAESAQTDPAERVLNRALNRAPTVQQILTDVSGPSVRCVGAHWAGVFERVGAEALCAVAARRAFSVAIAGAAGLPDGIPDSSADPADGLRGGTRRRVR